jgi:membrane protein implicated in regulation of membrane protease activity
LGIPGLGKPEAEAATIILASVGGMLGFFGLFFALIAAIAEPGFWTVALGAILIAIILFLLSLLSRRRQLKDWRALQSQRKGRARCQYCGTQNEPASRKCESCGAPLPRA